MILLGKFWLSSFWRHLGLDRNYTGRGVLSGFPQRLQPQAFSKYFKGEDKHTLKCYWQIFYCLKHSFLTSLPRQKKKSIHTFSPTCCNLQHHGLTFLYNSTCMQLIQFPLSLTSIIQLTYMLSITSAKKNALQTCVYNSLELWIAHWTRLSHTQAILPSERTRDKVTLILSKNCTILPSFYPFKYPS